MAHATASRAKNPDGRGPSNAMADRLAAGIAALGKVRLAWPCEANEVFAILPEARRDQLRARGAQFIDWSDGALPAGQRLAPGETIGRFVCSFATNPDDVAKFVGVARSSAVQAKELT